MQVPVLLTWDVDPECWATFKHRQNGLSMVLSLCEEFGVRSTFFITANYAHEYPAQIERMRALGQEIGCHGLTHTVEEDYDRMPVDLQRAHIEEATQKLETDAGQPIRSFRGPGVKSLPIRWNYRLIMGIWQIAQSVRKGWILSAPI